MADSFTPTAPIKLVIWDLDDTFWTGTLSEGGVSLIDPNIEIVKTLASRGIVSSIASKNDLESVKQVLIDAKIWDYFIFPQISWKAKGIFIANIIEQVNLRPDNILFIDDNILNIEEVRFQFPNMMVAHPDSVLPVLLDLDETTGKDDRAHSRLQQYKKLELKAADRTATTLSNEDFLRQCDIELHFEYKIDQHIDRIIELINRSNQLNYTKVRLESKSSIQAFKKSLRRHDIFAAAIFASDRYGEHGLIGFYMQLKNERVNTLLHYVWSCRMMNTGLEQYVYERLGEPKITIIKPVSNPLKVFPFIDWVKESSGTGRVSDKEDPRLLLIGSCDLTAVSSYCSQNRAEYVNGVSHGVMTRYDDFGFILGDAEKVENSTALNGIPSWSKADFSRFRSDLADTKILIVSLSAAMKGDYLLTNDGVAVRMHPEGLGYYIDIHPNARFLQGHKFYRLSVKQKTELLLRALSLMEVSSGQATHRFILGANTRNVGGSLSPKNLALLDDYNATCEAFCKTTSNWQFVPINEIVSEDKLVDDRHYTRMAYFEIADYIKKHSKASDTSPMRVPLVTTDLEALVRSGQPISRLNLFGEKQGMLAQIKRFIKLTPLSVLISSKSGLASEMA